MSNLFEHCRTGVSSASQRYEKPEAMQINLLFAEAKYSRCSQSAISLCQSAAGGGCAGRRRRSDAPSAWAAAAEERIFRNCILAGLRPAGSHCKNNLFSFRAHPAPPIGCLLQGADLPPFVTKRWRQKCPQGTSVGIGRRFSLSGHKRLRCCGAKDCTASTVAARQSPQAASALACCPSFCTPAPGARTAVRSDSSSGAMRRLLCASRNGNYSFASAHVRPLVFRRDGCLSSGSS